MSDVPILTIAEAARLIAARRLSPLDLAKSCIDRVAAMDGVLNSFLLVTAELALEQARSAEADIMRHGPRGPMHGVPYALKDIYDTAGIRTTAQSARCKDRVPAEDAHAVTLLQAAGGVLLGKLATHEFATGGPSWDLPWKPARNPWDLSRFTGGSSSGSGAAVAAGLVPGALGSDTGGSIRLPAALCGVAGIKPTCGRVSKRGVLPLSFTFDNAGPLAWTVEDCAILLEAISGHDPLDPASADVPVPAFRAGLAGSVKGSRIGLIRHWYEVDGRASDEVIAAMDAAVGVLRSLGAEVVEVTLPPLIAFQACMRVISPADSFAIHADHLRAAPHEYGEIFRYRIMPGAFVPATDYIQALRQQRILVQIVLEALRDVDALITATTWREAPVLGSIRAEANFGAPTLTNPFNVAQIPALSLCNGFSATGLPLAMQIAGRPFDEATLFRIGHAYEQATGWRARRPVPPPTPFIDTPVDHAAPTPAPAVSEAYALLATRTGLPLDARQFAQLCQALPYVEAMGAALPRDLPPTAQLSVNVALDAE